MELVPLNIFLDDEPEKRRHLKPAGFFHFDNIEDIKELLVQGKVDQLSLDRDLGACSSCCIKFHATIGASCEHVPTGEDLVRWMVDTGNWSLTKPVVHSLNKVAAARMRVMIDQHWKMTKEGEKKNG
jgi:hypothetical protein